MKAFDVRLNGKRLCVAGIGEEGVLTAIVDYAIGKGRNELFLNVGGLFSPTKEHAIWRRSPLKVGDKIAVHIIQTESVDKPKKRYRRDSKQDERSQKAYVRAVAKKLGWKIVTVPGKLK